MSDSRELLIEYLQKWAALYGRKIHDRAMDVWLGIFMNTNPNVLAAALMKVTENSERMPAPGNLRKAILDTADNMGAPGRREADPACMTCRGTGFDVSINPENESKAAKPCTCRTSDPEEQFRRWKYERERSVGQDPETGEHVPIVRDLKTGEELYRAQDCPEGREFINLMHKLLSEKTIPFPKPKSAKELEKERQRQKLEYSAYLKREGIDANA